MHLLPALACALVCAVAGWLVPRVIAALPEPEPDPDENPDDFPAKLPYAVLGKRPRLPLGCAIASGLAGGLLGAALGWDWRLSWLVALVPACCALAVVDYVTWYLPTRIVAPSYAVVAVLIVVAALAQGDLWVAGAGALGWAGLGGYYGLMWLISPRIMAYGDVRLGGLLGLALGPLGLGTVLLSAVLAGALGGLAFLPLRLLGNAIRRHVPFGPFLVVGALAAVVLGQWLGSP